jgi:Zn finger protein HypA/HybF involved in hydrogenase expression
MNRNGAGKGDKNRMKGKEIVSYKSSSVWCATCGHMMHLDQNGAKICVRCEVIPNNAMK